MQQASARNAANGLSEFSRSRSPSAVNFIRNIPLPFLKAGRQGAASPCSQWMTQTRNNKFHPRIAPILRYINIDHRRRWRRIRWSIKQKKWRNASNRKRSLKMRLLSSSKSTSMCIDRLRAWSFLCDRVSPAPPSQFRWQTEIPAIATELSLRNRIVRHAQSFPSYTQSPRHGVRILTYSERSIRQSIPPVPMVKYTLIRHFCKEGKGDFVLIVARTCRDLSSWIVTVFRWRQYHGSMRRSAFATAWLPSIAKDSRRQPT